MPETTAQAQRSVDVAFADAIRQAADSERAPDSALCPEVPMAALSRYLDTAMSKTKSEGLDCSRPWLVYWPLHTLDLTRAFDVSAVAGASPLLGPDRRRNLFEWVMASFTYERDFDSDASSSDDNESDNEAGNDDDEGALPSVFGVAHDRLWSTSPRRTSGRSGGGFSGGPGQAPHLASAYAAVCALCLLAAIDAAATDATPTLGADLQARLPRAAIQRWIASLRRSDGAFRMFRGGEADLRASYCAAVIATLLNLDSRKLFFPHHGADTATYVGACQTFDGGLGCGRDNGSEGHGGYTSCGMSALVLMLQLRAAQSPPETRERLSDGVDRVLNLDRLRFWSAMRQHATSGGFDGRTQKLADGCYSYWMASVFAALSLIDASRGVADSSAPLSAAATLQSQLLSANVQVACDAAAVDDARGVYLFDQELLCGFVAACCTDARSGGLRDKPPKPADLYHSCYVLSGLAIAQNGFYTDAVPELASTNSIAAGDVSAALEAGSKAAVLTPMVPVVFASRPSAADGASEANTEWRSQIVAEALEGAAALQRKREAALSQANGGPGTLATLQPAINMRRDRVRYILQLFGGRTHI